MLILNDVEERRGHGVDVGEKCCAESQDGDADGRHDVCKLSVLSLCEMLAKPVVLLMATV